MPFADSQNFEDCVHRRMKQSGYVKEVATKVCGKMKSNLEKAGDVVNEWGFDPASILQSPRKVKGKFHTPMTDKDKEYIQGEAVRNAVPDFMHLPILHDFHKERTVGIVTRVVELSDGSFDFEGLIKATDDCNDVWELIAKGNYDQVSIYGKRTGGNGSCSLRPEQRKEPCVTNAIRLDSISVCDDNARNEGTSLTVAKGGKVVFTANDELIKAETTDSSLMHTATDRVKTGKDGLPRTKKKCTATCPQYERQELGKGDDMNEVEEKGKIEMPGRGIPKKGKFDSHGRNYKPPTERESGADSSWAGESRKADDEPEIPGEDPEAESIEETLQKLEAIVEGLVQKDEEEKGIREGSNKHTELEPKIGERDAIRQKMYGDGRSSLDKPEAKADEPYELPPEKEREYGAPIANETREDVEVEPVAQPEAGNFDETDQMAAKIHLSKKVEEEKANLVPEEKAVQRINLTGREGHQTSQQEIDHVKNLYESGKPEYQAQQAREAETIAEQEAMKRPPKVDPADLSNPKKLNPDSARVDMKAEPKEKPTKDWSSEGLKQTRYDGSQPSSMPSIDPNREAAENAYVEHYNKENPDKTPLKTRKEHRKEVIAQVKEKTKAPSYKERNKGSGNKTEATNPPWSGQKHSSTERGNASESSEVTSKIPPSKLPESQGSTDIRRIATTDDRKMSEPKHPTTPGKPDTSDVNTHLRSKTPEWKDIGGEPSGTERSKPIDRGTPKPKVGSYESESAKIPERTSKRVTEGNFTSKPESERPAPVSDKDRYGKFDTTSERKPSGAEVTEEPKFVREAKAGGEMGDIKARLDRLVALVARLTQTDEAVHEQMDSPVNEEEKAISKGTENMKDEEVDTLVKAKVDAQVESITKAFQASLDELKKANADLAEKVEKMENETIEKSGVVAILRPGDEDIGDTYPTNAAAVSAISKAKKAGA
jgi:hypothetical protein